MFIGKEMFLTKVKLIKIRNLIKGNVTFLSINEYLKKRFYIFTKNKKTSIKID